ncbi:MAG: translation initiation factor IF-3 [Deltaproteobacteria bacterium]|nr:translation initiation factor IF-3 [Deltaproteobacteria bacterium]
MQGGLIIQNPQTGKKRPQKTRINEMIRRPDVRLINPDGQQLGIYPTRQALAIAQEMHLDLVEISPNANPSVCKIMDYGKYKYELKKQAQAAKKNQKIIELKEVKMRPKTDTHDFNFKIKHIRRFIAEGNKTKVTIRFRGREIAHPEMAAVILDKVVAALADIAEVQQKYQFEGKTMTTILTPSAKGSALAKSKKILMEEELEELDDQDDFEDNMD